MCIRDRASVGIGLNVKIKTKQSIAKEKYIDIALRVLAQYFHRALDRIVIIRRVFEHAHLVSGW